MGAVARLGASPCPRGLARAECPLANPAPGQVPTVIIGLSHPHVPGAQVARTSSAICSSAERCAGLTAEQNRLTGGQGLHIFIGHFGQDVRLSGDVKLQMR